MPINSAILSKYSNKLFVETGTYRGDGVQAALDAGFEKLYSVEVDEKSYAKVQARFQHNTKVALYLGDSKVLLPQILTQLNAPTTFWLDAHEAANVACPILDELRLIVSHKPFEHTILIDDMRIFTHHKQRYGGISIDDVMHTLTETAHSVKRAYNITMIDSHGFKLDILAAVPTQYILE